MMFVMLIEKVMIQFMILYFCNLLLDFPLQGEYLAMGKEESNYLLWVHSAIWGFGLSIVLLPLGLFTWAKVIMLVCGHFLIDYCKAHKLYNRIESFEGGEVTNGLTDEQALYVDQFLHLLQVMWCLI